MGRGDVKNPFYGHQNTDLNQPVTTRMTIEISRKHTRSI